MYTHEPQNYKCPFCRIAKGIEDEFVFTRQNDIFYRDEYIMAFIASHWWPNNQGHIIIMPNSHIENIYNLPNSLSNKIHALEKKVSIALKKLYRCDGVSSRQHNEPCGDQDVWHYHLHIFPRYKGDNLYALYSKRYKSEEKDRTPFATRLKAYFEKI